MSIESWNDFFSSFFDLTLQSNMMKGCYNAKLEFFLIQNWKWDNQVTCLKICKKCLGISLFTNLDSVSLLHIGSFFNSNEFWFITDEIQFLCICTSKNLWTVTFLPFNFFVRSVTFDNSTQTLSNWIPINPYLIPWFPFLKPLIQNKGLPWFS